LTCIPSYRVPYPQESFKKASGISCTGSNGWQSSGDLHSVWKTAAPDLYDMMGPTNPDSAMTFKNGEGFDSSLSALNLEDNLSLGVNYHWEAMPNDVQQVLAQDEAFWMKYQGANWEDWGGDVCEWGPEDQCSQ